jgi:hypothetical protein
MSHVEEPRRALDAAGNCVIVDPDLPARTRKTLAAGLPLYSDFSLYTEDEAPVFASLSGIAIVLSAPLGGASFWLARQSSTVWDEYIARPLLGGLGAVLTGLGAVGLLGWGLVRGVPLIRPALARRAYKRLATRHRDQAVVVGELDAVCRSLGERALRSVDAVLKMSAERSAVGGAEAEARLPYVLWEIGQDLQKISDLGSPSGLADADPEEDLVQQAVAAVTARVEAIEAEAGQLAEELRQDEEIRAAGRRAIAQTETDREAALRHEALLDVVARTQARQEADRPQLSTGGGDRG